MTKFEIKIAENITIPEKIESNIAELESLIKEKEDLAKSLVVTDDMSNVDAAEKDAAEIAKLGKALARFRIDFIKKWKSPVETFETTCKSYEKRLDAAANDLRTKTGEVRQIAANKKRDDLHELYTKLIGEMIPDGVRDAEHFENFFAKWTNQSTTGCWLNKGVTIEKVRSSIEDELTRCTCMIAAVEETYENETEDIKAKARLAMRKNFDIADVVYAVNSYKKEQEAIARAKAEAAERERARLEAQAKSEAERKAKEDEANNAKVVEPFNPPRPMPGVHMYSLTLKFTATKEQLKELRSFVDEKGIKAEKIGEITIA